MCNAAQLRVPLVPTDGDDGDQQSPRAPAVPEAPFRSVVLVILVVDATQSALPSQGIEARDRSRGNGGDSTRYDPPPVSSRLLSLLPRVFRWCRGADGLTSTGGADPPC